MMPLDKEFWEKRYHEGTTQWDIGHVSTPLKEYIDQLKDMKMRILVPGAGNGYEALYLHEQGFDNVWVVDIASIPLQHLQKKGFPEERLIEGDFFELTTDQYDLILEQTFFCALPPQWRTAYVKKMHNLLKPGGKLAGLLFDFPLTDDGPPYGGDRQEYLERFSKKFTVRKLERAYNSIRPRQGTELFFIFEKH
ncbi:MAG: methyltransferase domain-containing protein [Flavobacteriaceae bacterium]